MIEFIDSIIYTFTNPIVQLIHKITKQKFPCKDCLILPLGCNQLCDKVEMNYNKLSSNFIRVSLDHKVAYCPDCGMSKLHVGDTGVYPYTWYCNKCKHKFTIGEYFLPMFKFQCGCITIRRQQ
ncbi:MAG: hypothetical protein ACFFG0_01430 [Candidatus Thorarchaeota archaeon]